MKDIKVNLNHFLFSNEEEKKNGFITNEYELNNKIKCKMFSNETTIRINI